MSLRLALARIYLPRFVVRRELSRLIALTAEAFDAPFPAPAGRSFEAVLEAYARWTKAQADRVAADGALVTEVRTRLRRLAFDFGRRLGKMLGVRTQGDVMRAAGLLYRILHIDFEGAETGEILISRCYFGRFYAPETCAVIASLDEGLLAGLAGGGRLEFSARITEGEDSCRACFVFPGDLS